MSLKTGWVRVVSITSPVNQGIRFVTRPISSSVRPKTFAISRTAARAWNVTWFETIAARRRP